MRPANRDRRHGDRRRHLRIGKVIEIAPGVWARLNRTAGREADVSIWLDRPPRDGQNAPNR